MALAVLQGECYYRAGLQTGTADDFRNAADAFKVAQQQLARSDAGPQASPVDPGGLFFQRIMAMPEYYLTGCELEIFQTQRGDILRALGGEPFELIELGDVEVGQQVRARREELAELDEGRAELLEPRTERARALACRPRPPAAGLEDF